MVPESALVHTDPGDGNRYRRSFDRDFVFRAAGPDQLLSTNRASRPQRRQFYVDDAPFRGFSLLYNYGIPQVLRQQAEGRSPWNAVTRLGLPFWLSVPALIAAEVVLAWGFLRGMRDVPAHVDEADQRHLR